MPLASALNVEEYESATAVLHVIVGVTGSNATVKLLGGMSKDSEDAWVEVLTFGTLNPGVLTTVVVRTDKLLRYLRWDATGTFTGLAFTVQGFAQGD
jgi:hypothetical protein